LIAADTFKRPLDINESEWKPRFQVDKAMLVLMPLQGFFNFLIFISLKVYYYRKMHNEAGLLQAVMKVITEPIQEPCYITRVSIVNHDSNDVSFQDIDHGNGGVDIDLTRDNHAEQGHSVTSPAENSIFVLSMCDESGTSNLLYRIKLFTADIQQQTSNSLSVDMKESSSHERDSNEYDDTIDIEQENKSDDYSSIPRMSCSIKSDNTYNAEEQRKIYVNTIFSHDCNRHQSKHGTYVDQRS
jgi:hypothetical protein